MSEKKADFPSHPNYEIKQQLGKGGFGSVYKVINKNDNKIYAIKRIEIKGLNQKELEFIQNEANILSNIENENIVKYHESFYEDDFFNIVMDYCEFGDLRKILNEFKTNGQFMSKNAIYYLAKSICLGLKEIHKNNLIHRDLKPENLFLKNDLKLMIGDFGVAKQLQNGTIHANTQIGTFQYMAPEIIKNEKYSNKVDIYSLGCIIYELCTLNLYFGNKTEGKINVSLYGNDLQNLIDKLVEIEPNKRPSINEIEEIINKIINECGETGLIKAIKKNELLKTFILEICVSKYLDKMKTRILFREKRKELFFNLGISSISTTLSTIGFFAAGPIGIGLSIAGLVVFGLSFITKKLLKNSYSKKDEFVQENEMLFELIEMKMQKKIIDNFDKKIPKEKKLLFIMMKISRKLF